MLYNAQKGWCHDCKVWYFPNETRPDAKVGEKVVLRLVDQRPESSLWSVPAEVQQIELEAVVYGRTENPYGYVLNCSLQDEGELYEAIVFVTFIPNTCDSVKIQPQV